MHFRAAAIAIAPVTALEKTSHTRSMNAFGRNLSPSDYQQVGSNIFGSPSFSNGANQTQSSAGSLFGSSVVLSNDGMRLAIGAPGYDADSSLIGSGGVFLFDFNSTNWNRFTSLIGNQGEGLGLSMDMSGDGTRVAVRRSFSSVNSSVEVYDLSSSTRLGFPMTCESSGSFVTISNDGSRVAVSCEFSAPNGYLEVFEWNGIDWDSIGRVLGTVNGSEFGYSSAFDANGTRLSVSAPMYSAGSLESNGLVRVFDFNASSLSWEQIGNDLVGNASFDRFGDAFDLSGSGLTLAAIASGVIHVFELEGNDWASKGSVEGAFSSAVSISDDGKTLAAGMVNGEIMTLEFNGTDWNQIHGLIDDINAGGNISGAGPRGLSLSSSGFRIAAGSQFGNNNDDIQTGVVRVFGHSEPTQPPSQSPVPFEFVTEIPTVILDKFSWDIERIGLTIISFDDNSTQSEITLSYNTSRRASSVQIFQQNCLSSVGQDVISVSKNTTIISSTNQRLDIILDIQQDSVIGSSIWRDGNSVNEGYIELCIRIDLLLDDSSQSSVTFHEQKLFLTIGLSQGFQVSEVDLERDAADEESEDITVDYEIDTCQCNSFFECEEVVLVQGDDVFICIFTESIGIEISMIEELSFSQGPISILVIENNTADGLSAIENFGKMAVARSQLRSLFFDTPQPDNLVVNGRALITFVDESDSNPNRNLRIANTRVMQQNLENQDIGFGLNLMLASSSSSDQVAEGSGNGSAIVIGSALVGCLAGVALVVALFIWKKKRSAREKHEVSAL